MKISMIRTFFAALLLACSALCAPSEAASWDMAGRWLIEGTGYGEYSPVRLTLNLDGYMDAKTALSGDIRYLTGYDLDLRLDVSGMSVETWREQRSETFREPVPLPEMNPTLSQPFTLPEFWIDDLRVKIELRSESSGKVDIYGTIDLDVIGRTEVNSVSAFWREGTEKPDVDDLDSGCASFMSALALLPVVFLIKHRRR